MSLSWLNTHSWLIKSTGNFSPSNLCTSIISFHGLFKRQNANNIINKLEQKDKFSWFDTVSNYLG